MRIAVALKLRESRLAPTGKKGRKGATSVELAVVAPVVFFLFLSIVEIARGIMVVHLLNNAAQAGCRDGIIEGQSTANITTVVTNALTQAGISGDTVTVQVNDATADASTAGVGAEITVTVTVPISSVTWIPGTRYLSGSLKGQYTMRRE